MPAERLRDRRKERDELDYRNQCENVFGFVILGDEKIHPADVLDNCAPDAARRGRAEVKEQIRSAVEQDVCDLFPATIAIPWHRFLEGPDEPLRRVHHLRDTWEALIRLLAALAIGEAVCCIDSAHNLQLRESESQGYRLCNPRDLRSDRLSIRIGIIEGVLKCAHQARVSLGLASILPMDVVAEIRRLNVVRNGFSHESAKSDKQAQAIIDDAGLMLRELLVDIRDLKEIELFRLDKITPSASGADVTIEKLVGHSQSQSFRAMHFEADALDILMKAGDVGGLHRVLAKMDNRIIDLSPFLYSTVDVTGHRPRLLEFRQNLKSEWLLECVAESVTDRVLAAPHVKLLERFHCLMDCAGKS